MWVANAWTFAIQPEMNLFRAQNQSTGDALKAIAIKFLVAALLCSAILMIGNRLSDQRRRRNAEKFRAKSDIHQIEILLGVFKNNLGRFPTTEEGLGLLVTNPGWNPAPAETPLDPWGRPYIYRSPGRDGSDFDLVCAGPSGREGAADNIWWSPTR
jgi:general secretion pathway protein G